MAKGALLIPPERMRFPGSCPAGPTDGAGLGSCGGRRRATSMEIPVSSECGSVTAQP